jgi:serine/threonine-protein kinase
VSSAEREEFKKRFFREAKSAARLNHPNIVTVFDAGEVEDVAYIAMELLDGQDLRHFLTPDNRLSLERCAQIVADVANALDYAHREGVIHRDVKPGNIVLLANGTVKLADFGIARLQSGNATQTGQMFGTPKYMAPEQITGRPADARTDIFSLGVVLYQLATGTAPFDGETFSSIMFSVIQEPALSPSDVIGKVPKGFEYIISKSLAKKPENRYQSAAEMERDLRRLAMTDEREPLPWGVGGIRSRAEAEQAAQAAQEAAAAVVPAAAPAAAAPAPATPAAHRPRPSDETRILTVPPAADAAAAAKPATQPAAAPPAAPKAEAAPASEPAAKPAAAKPPAAKPLPEPMDLLKAPPQPTAQGAPAAFDPLAALDAAVAKSPPAAAPAAPAARQAKPPAPKPADAPRKEAKTEPKPEAKPAPKPAPPSKPESRAEGKPASREDGDTRPPPKPAAGKPGGSAAALKFGTIAAAIVAVAAFAAYFAKRGGSGGEAAAPPAAPVAAASEPVAAPPAVAVAPAAAPAAALPSPAASDAAAGEAAKKDAAGGEGKLALAVTPWGEVFINGENKGISPPLNELTLPAGEYEVVIKNGDLKPFEQKIVVKAGERRRITFKFQE